ncbi:MAG TPA: hypothetical protein VHU80_23475, partial [Polyangiaceae bacterium]|nr:hypothetical protein [Polyangiaceae bacterium]
MRCALVALELGVGLAGVDKAMAGQARAAKELGAPLDVIVVGQNGTGSGAADGVRYVRFDTRWLRLGRLSRLVKARLLASVPALLDYDAVFLRYPTAIDLDPLRFLRRARGRVATVHHAKEPSELLAVARTSGGFARVAIERLQGYRVLRRVHGIVGVTDEIRDYEV